MTAVTEWAFANATMAMVLAVPAYFSSYLRRPALTHALWLLVLLRLVAPPLWRLELPATTVQPVAPSPVVATAPSPEPALAVIGDDALQATVALEPSPVAGPGTVAAPPAIETPPPAIPNWDWSAAAAAIWFGGAALCLTLAASRIARFRRILRFTQPAPCEWAELARPIVERMRLRRTPEIRLMPGSVAPLLWAAFGRPVLLVPAALAERLDDERRSALIAHELAHLRRGDHLVRWFELVVTAIYWWNPAIWLARRELREAEEQLCDAWVVRVLPDARRAYATALVDTVDFLSEARPVLPPLASGLGEVRNLERRVVMILQGHAPRPRSRWTMGLCLAAGLGLLTFSPGWADEDPPAPPAPPRAPQPPDLPAGAAKTRERRAIPAAQVEEAEQLRNEIRRMHEALGRLENRLAELEGRPAARGGEARGGEGRGPVRARAGGPPATPDVPPAPAGAPTAPVPPGRFGGMNPPGFPGAGGFGGGPGGGMGGQGPNFERRMDEMQRAIERLAQQMEEMRRMVGEQQRRGPGREGQQPQPREPRGERPAATAGR